MAGPIFVVGAMGSGTTLLRLMLDSHRNIAIPQETGFMRGYDAIRFTPFKWSGKNWTKRLGWSRKEIDARMGGFYEELFMRYATEHGKTRWGDKTPLHTWHIDDMARLFPDAQFVGVVRHPFASVSSNMGRFTARLSRACWHWHRYSQELARQAEHHADRFALLRYEELVLQPEAVMRELLDWLGEPWDGAVLEHHAVQGSRGGKRKVEGRSLVDDPIDVSRIDKWTRTLGEDHKAWLAHRLTRLGAFFGYSVTDAAVLDPLAPDGALLIRGADLTPRIDAYADLELRTRVTPPRYDGAYDPRELMIIRVDRYEELLAPRGLRKLGVRLVRLVPGRDVRRSVILRVRRIRGALGLSRRRLQR